MHDTGTYGHSSFSKNIYKCFEIEIPTKLYVLFISLPESLDIKLFSENKVQYTSLFLSSIPFFNG